LKHAKRVPYAITFDPNSHRQLSTERQIQKLIDDAPPTHRELLAYALYCSYLSIRFPNLPVSPEPPELAALPPGHKRYIVLNDTIFIFDFAPPALRPRGTLADALRSRRASVHLFTQPQLVESWNSRVKVWPHKVARRIDTSTVPRWLCMGIGLLRIQSWQKYLACFECLLERTNRCLLQFPAAPLQIVWNSQQASRNADSSRA